MFPRPVITALTGYQTIRINPAVTSHSDAPQMRTHTRYDERTEWCELTRSAWWENI